MLVIRALNLQMLCGQGTRGLCVLWGNVCGRYVLDLARGHLAYAQGAAGRPLENRCGKEQEKGELHPVAIAGTAKQFLLRTLSSACAAPMLHRNCEGRGRAGNLM